MIADTAAAVRAGQPQIDRPRLIETQQHAEPMDDQRRNNDPDGSEDEEQLGSDYEIDDKIAVGDAGKHLRSRKSHKQPVTL